MNLTGLGCLAAGSRSGFRRPICAQTPEATQPAATFEDVQALAKQGRFRNCPYENEPGCVVRAQLDADRLANYQKLLRDAQRAELTPLERIEQRNKWKVLGRAGSQRAREKRG